MVKSLKEGNTGRPLMKNVNVLSAAKKIGLGILCYLVFIGAYNGTELKNAINLLFLKDKPWIVPTEIYADCVSGKVGQVIEGPIMRYEKQGRDQCLLYGFNYLSQILGKSSFNYNDIEIRLGAAGLRLKSILFPPFFTEEDSGIPPEAAIDVANMMDLDMTLYDLHFLSIADRQHYIDNLLNQGRPIIALIETKRNTSHWISLVNHGTNDQGEAVYYIYDSNLPEDPNNPGYTEDQNGSSQMGNRTITKEEFFQDRFVPTNWWYNEQMILIVPEIN